MKFEQEAMRLLRELPKESSDFPFSVALFYNQHSEDRIHCRIEWNEESAIITWRKWLIDIDAEIINDAPTYPEDTRSPEDYWRDVRPTIESGQQTVLNEIIYGLKLILGNLRLPVLSPVPDEWYLDCAVYELSFSHKGAVSVWKWSDKPPRPWIELESVVAIIIREVQSIPPQKP